MARVADRRRELHEQLVASKEAGARFRREAFVGVRLLHPNGVPVLVRNRSVARNRAVSRPSSSSAESNA